MFPGWDYILSIWGMFNLDWFPTAPCFNKHYFSLTAVELFWVVYSIGTFSQFKCMLRVFFYEDVYLCLSAVKTQSRSFIYPGILFRLSNPNHIIYTECETLDLLNLTPAKVLLMTKSILLLIKKPHDKLWNTNWYTKENKYLKQFAYFYSVYSSRMNGKQTKLKT